MRTPADKYRSLNESINEVQNPHTALQEAMEYAAALEAVILDICEKLDLDPDALVEDVFDSARSASVSRGNVKLAQKQEKAGAARKGFAAKVKAKHEKMKKSKTTYGVSDEADDADWAHRNFGQGRPLRGKKGTGQVRLVRKGMDGSEGIR